MTYINYKINNDTHLVKTLAEFKSKEKAKQLLPQYQLFKNNYNNIYLSRRSTQEWRNLK